MRNLLVAISNDPSALHGVKFVADFFQDLERITVTLFASLPGNPETDATETAVPLPDTDGQTSISASFTDALEESRAILERAGMPEQNITDRIEACVRSVEFHLALEGVVGTYDALVLGRRGVQSLSQLVSESLSERLFLNNLKIPCWACRLYQPDRHGVLLCVDQSSRIAVVVRHVASICAANPGHPITLLHVCTPGEKPSLAAAMLQEADAMLQEEGISAERISSLAVQDDIAARAILREATQGRFAAVAIAKSESDDSDSLEASGSTGRTLLRDLSGAALWFAG